MKYASIISIFIFILASQGLVRSQSDTGSGSADSIIEASHAVGDVGSFLQKNTRYPLEALKKGVQGDIILSFFINKEGKAENLLISGSTSDLLSTSSVLAFDALDDHWRPATINNYPIGKAYKVVFRYRIFRESQPPDLKSKAQRMEQKEKYSKALKLYDKAIFENKYDFELFEHRAKVKEMVGDAEGAKLDMEASLELKSEILALVDLTAILKTRTKTEVRRRF